MTSLAFDIYGTLIDTNGVTAVLQKLIGSEAAKFSQVWRDKQLEYSFRRGLMRSYQDFSVCTRNALDYTCRFLNHSLSVDHKIALMAEYGSLPAFSDVSRGLISLEKSSVKIIAFSNGTRHMIGEILKNAGLEDHFSDIVSVEDVCSFKPDPAVYNHLLEQSGSPPNLCWVISSNPFDVIGAKSAGLRAVWVKRNPDAVFDPWGIEPDEIVSSIDQLSGISLA